MIEAEPGDGERDPLAAPAQLNYDFSAVQGFQVVGADYHVAGQNAGGDELWRDALRLELETRAARFHHAVEFGDRAFQRWRHSMVGRSDREAVARCEHIDPRRCNAR